MNKRDMAAIQDLFIDYLIGDAVGENGIDDLSGGIFGEKVEICRMEGERKPYVHRRGGD